MNPHETVTDLAALEKLRDAHARVRQQIRAVVVGQDSVIDELMAGIFAGGHCILEGVPGLAKTLLVQTLAKSLPLQALDPPTGVRGNSPVIFSRYAAKLALRRIWRDPSLQTLIYF